MQSRTWKIPGGYSARFALAALLVCSMLPIWWLDDGNSYKPYYGLLFGLVKTVKDQIETGYICDAGAWLNITGKDANDRSFWQRDSASAKLQVNAAVSTYHGRLKAIGKFQIDTGTVQLTSLTDGSPALLEGAGLIFGDANATAFIIGAGQTPGQVRIKGPVELGQNTTTTMNYKGATNTSTRLIVDEGYLTLDGTLYLNSLDTQKPTQPLDFFSVVGANPAIYNAFDSIIGNLVMATYSGQEVEVTPNDLRFRVTIT